MTDKQHANEPLKKAGGNQPQIDVNNLKLKKMKKMLQKALPLAMVVLALGANAQVKVGSNPTTLADSANFQVEALRGSQFFIHKGTGNVGIGTTAPDKKLEVVGGGVGTDARVLARNDGWAGFDVRVATGTTGGSNPYFSTNASRGTVAAPTYVKNGDVLGQLRFSNHVSDASGAQIFVIATEDHSTTAGGGAIKFTTSLNGTNTGYAERMRIDNNGNVGIGTTAPDKKLEVVGGGVGTDARVLARNDGWAGFDVRVATGTTGGSNPYFSTGASRGTVAAPTYVKNGDILGQIRFSNHVSDASGAQIFVIATEDHSTTAGGGAIKFTTSLNGTNTGYAERMRIDNNGNVGIGTTAPDKKLEVVGGGVGTDARVLARNDGWAGFDVRVATGTTGGSNPYFSTNASRGTVAAPTYVKNGDVLGQIRFSNHVSDASGAQIFVIATEDHSTTAGGGAIKFTTSLNGTNTGYAERMRIDNNGNVGIGTTAPDKKLEVVGGGVGTDARVLARNDGWAGFDVRVATGTTGGSNPYFSTNASRGTVAAPTYVKNGDVLGQLRFSNHVSDASGAQIFVIATEDHSTTAGGGAIKFTTSLNGTNTGYAERMRIDNNGNVGIGTTAPDKKLEVVGGGVGTDARVLARNDGWAGFDVRVATGTTGGSNPYFSTGASRGTVAAPTYVKNGDILGQIRFSNHVSDASGAQIFVIATEDHSTTAGGGAITFTTSQNGTNTAYAERMRINNNGNVGIGTNAPTSKLQVVGLPVYANNAAAITAGLTAGAFYHAGDGIVRVVF